MHQMLLGIPGDQHNNPVQVVQAGPLNAQFSHGDLRYIRLKNREVIRRVYVAIRDCHWQTVRPDISNVRITSQARSFAITFTCRHCEGDIDFTWEGTITGASDGTITFTMNGQARSTFLKNRIGICVLHPIDECAGVPFTILHDDGSIESGVFPRYISPDQPAKEIRAISYDVLPGLMAELHFSGDIFEMEDQRNWTDASFKTYSTPLRYAWPVKVEAGSRISQAVRLSLRGEVTSLSTPSSRTTITLGPPSAIPFPLIGLGMASHGQPIREQEAHLLTALHLAHLHVDLRLETTVWTELLTQAIADAKMLRVPLEIAVFATATPEVELATLANVLRDLKPDVCRWIVLDTTGKPAAHSTLNLARRQLAVLTPQAKIGTGTDSDFAVLNRHRPAVQNLDFVSYSMNPQMHAFDNASLVENLAGQTATIGSARHFVNGAALCISSVTLKPRLRADPSSPESQAGNGLPNSVDLRQMSLFGAAWTVGSLQQVAEGGVLAATFYETTGWLGVMETMSGSPLPHAFPSQPGWVFPMYHVFRDIGEFANGIVVPITSSHPLEVQGLAIRKNAALRMMLANLTSKQVDLRLRNVGGFIRLRALDETNCEFSMRAPDEFRRRFAPIVETTQGEIDLHILPHGVVRVDCPGGQGAWSNKEGE